MKITAEHPASSYGFPVIVDGKGEVLDYPAGVQAVRRTLGLTVDQLGELVGKSGRTVEGWEQGRRTPPTEALYVMAKALALAGNARR